MKELINANRQWEEKVVRAACPRYDWNCRAVYYAWKKSDMPGIAMLWYPPSWADSSALFFPVHPRGNPRLGSGKPLYIAPSVTLDWSRVEVKKEALSQTLFLPLGYKIVAGGVAGAFLTHVEEAADWRAWQERMTDETSVEAILYDELSPELLQATLFMEQAAMQEEASKNEGKASKGG